MSGRFGCRASASTNSVAGSTICPAFPLSFLVEPEVSVVIESGRGRWCMDVGLFY
jgi:hypothetical protein